MRLKPSSTGGTESGALVPSAIASTSRQGSRKKRPSQRNGRPMTKRMLPRALPSRSGRCPSSAPARELTSLAWPTRPREALAARRDGSRGVGRGHDHRAVGLGGDVIERAVAFIGDVDDLAGHGLRQVGPRGRQRDLLRPQRHPAAAGQGEDVGDADEVGHEARGRLLVDLVRRADLGDAAGVHDGQPRRHRHGLFLVVRHHDEGEAELFLQAHHLEARALAQLAVERGQRLVEQQQLGPLHQRPCQRHPLALAARELRGLALRVVLEMHQLQDLGDPRGDLGRLHPVAAQPVAHVRRHIHVREQGVGLEHHVHRPPVGRHVGHVLAVDEQPAFVGRLEARQHAQQGGLAAARAAQQREQLAARDLRDRPCRRRRSARSAWSVLRCGRSGLHSNSATRLHRGPQARAVARLFGRAGGDGVELRAHVGRRIDQRVLGNVLGQQREGRLVAVGVAGEFASRPPRPWPPA